VSAPTPDEETAKEIEARANRLVSEGQRHDDGALIDQAADLFDSIGRGDVAWGLRPEARRLRRQRAVEDAAIAAARAATWTAVFAFAALVVAVASLVVAAR
jgi:hypothetical protein